MNGRLVERAAVGAAQRSEMVALMRSCFEGVTAERFEGFMGHLAETLDDIGFADPRQSRKLMRRLRRLFRRADPDEEEINILRGVLKAAQDRRGR